MKYKVLRSFYSEDHRNVLQTGQLVELRQGAELADRGFVQPVKKQVQTKPLIPEVQIKHLGGPWYEVAGKRIKGKKNAEDYAANIS